MMNSAQPNHDLLHPHNSHKVLFGILIAANLVLLAVLLGIGYNVYELRRSNKELAKIVAQRQTPATTSQQVNDMPVVSSPATESNLQTGQLFGVTFQYPQDYFFSDVSVDGTFTMIQMDQAPSYRANEPYRSSFFMSRAYSPDMPNMSIDDYISQYRTGLVLSSVQVEKRRVNGNEITILRGVVADGPSNGLSDLKALIPVRGEIVVFGNIPGMTTAEEEAMFSQIVNSMQVN